MPTRRSKRRFVVAALFQVCAVGLALGALATDWLALAVGFAVVGFVGSCVMAHLFWDAVLELVDAVREVRRINAEIRRLKALDRKLRRPA